MTTIYDQAANATSSELLLAYIGYQKNPRTKLARQVLPVLTAEIAERGLDVNQGRHLAKLKEDARTADQRSHAAYDHMGVSAAGPNGEIAQHETAAQRLWREAAELEAQINGS